MPLRLGPALAAVSIAFAGQTALGQMPGSPLDDLGPAAIDTADPALWEQMRDIGGRLALRGRFDLAQEQAARSLALAERHLAADDPRLALYAMQLACFKFRLGDSKAADPLAKRGVSILEKTKPRSVDLAVALGVLAGIQSDCGRLDDAEASIRRALAVGEAAGLSGPQLSPIRRGLGELYSVRGKRAEAEALLRRTLSEAEGWAPDTARDFELSRCTRVLGILLHDGGRDAEALPLYLRSVHHLEAAAGTSNPELIGPLVDLGRCQEALGRLDEARATLRRAAVIAGQVSGAIPRDEARAKAEHERIQRLAPVKGAAPPGEGPGPQADNAVKARL